MEIEPIRSPMTRKLIDSLYVEAMMLADQARAYFDCDGRADRLALDPIARVGFACESLKVTTRLMHIIAWLLTQRAIDAGELSPAQARVPTRRLGEAGESDPDMLRQLPEQARILVQSSLDLFARIERLEKSGGDSPDHPSPARGLLSRLQRSL